MARRKRIIEDSDDSDSGEEENSEFEEEESVKKKRKKNGKHDALYGIFADSDDDQEEQKSRRKKADWTKAPAFVSGDKIPETAAQGEEYSDDNSGKDNHSEDPQDEQDDDDDESRPASPDIRQEEEEEEEERPRFGGGGIGSRSLGGIGSRSLAGGIASRPPTTATAEPTPTAFSSRPSFVRNASTTPKPISPADAAHFSKLSGSFGARMLAKMGWEAGAGLGTSGEGIVTPVESKLRPQKMGIAFKGFREKTDQSKKEARRRGEEVSDDEMDKKEKRKRRKEKEEGERKKDVWRTAAPAKQRKVKVEHKTYEQILEEAGGQDATTAGVGQILDATGATPREVSSISEAIHSSAWIGTQRIPEVRHNLQAVVNVCKTELDGLAREGKALEERKRWAVNEDLRLRRKVAEEAELIARLQNLTLITNDISQKAKELSSSYEATLDPFSPLFYKLLSEYPLEFNRYRLDEVVVAAISPLVRRMVASWDPLQDPSAFVSTFKSWRGALKVNEPPPAVKEQVVDVYGSSTTVSNAVVQTELLPMTPFESLLWTVWLPKVRSAINNDWAPHVPTPAVRLYEAWSSFLPAFIRDNLLDQLILPKVQKAVAEWHARKSAIELGTLVFAWLPHVGEGRMDEFLGEPKRKVRACLKSWSIDSTTTTTTPNEEPVLPMTDLKAWKDGVFGVEEWDALMLKHVVPKLSAHLRHNLRINPRAQNMSPLTLTFAWAPLVRPSILNAVLEVEFFGKWLETLYVWLVQPGVSFEEVAQWYEYWKGVFGSGGIEGTEVDGGFVRGLQLMNKAIELGPEAPRRLGKPEWPPSRGESSSSRPGTPGAGGKRVLRTTASRTHEITFRSIVEDFAATHDLMLIPTGRAHPSSRMPLFRVSPTTDGKKGLLVYVLDDAVWAHAEGSAGGDGDDYRAITLDDMVRRAGM